LVFCGKIRPPDARFRPALKFLTNFLVIFIFISLCIACSKLFQLEGEC